MGEVYRATDTKLGREVAIKVLPDEVARDPERLGRFQREAHLLAALNHPQIAAIYGLEEANDQPFLVLEHVPGEDLAERLKRGGLPVEEALDIARQIAEALEAAHERGIVHRDLKPANVKLTPDGQVKVLDFGLAKAWAGDAGVTSSTGALSQSPTLAHTGTVAGVILGTAAYMSPEQARGKPVGRRADVWSFGVLLFEMLTGQPLFGGETATDVIAAVVTREPEWGALPAQTPREVRRLLERCLRRDPRSRLPDIGAARLELEEAIAGAVPAAGAGGADEVTTVGPRRGRALAWTLGLAAAVLGIGFVLGQLRARPPSDDRVLSFTVEPPQATSFYLHTERPGVVTVSPDGRMLAFTAEAEGRYRLYVRPLSSTVARPVASTEGAQYPFWSRDSRQVGFFAEGKLRKVQVAAGGAPPVTLCDAPEVKGASWGAAGTIVFAPSFTGPLHRVSENGGESSPVTVVNAERKEDSHRHPRFLPDGRHFLYLARVGGGSADNAVVVGSVDGGEGRLLLRSPAAAEYAAGHLLFLRERTLMARPFDAGRLEFEGEAVPIAEDVRLVAAGTALAVFSASANGVLAYEPGGAATTRRLVWRDRAGKELGGLGEPGDYFDVRLSPDGSLAFVTRGEQSGGNADVWIYEAARNLGTRLTFDPADEWGGAWAPDGRSVVFASNRDGNYDLYRATVGASAADEPLLVSDRLKYPGSFSPDGTLFAFTRDDPETSLDIWILPMDGKGEPYPFLQGPYSQSVGRFSPDGRWLAYHSDESGRLEVYVAPFPGPGRKWQVSTRGGSWPEWRGDGAELFYQASDGTLTAVSVETRREALVIGAPQALFPFDLADTNFKYTVTAGGQRFLVVEPVGPRHSQPLTVVVNWTANLPR